MVDMLLDSAVQTTRGRGAAAAAATAAAQRTGTEGVLASLLVAVRSASV
jgi:hypothetical protein